MAIQRLIDLADAVLVALPADSRAMAPALALMVALREDKRHLDRLAASLAAYRIKSSDERSKSS